MPSAAHIDIDVLLLRCFPIEINRCQVNHRIRTLSSRTHCFQIHHIGCHKFHLVLAWFQIGHHHLHALHQLLHHIRTHAARATRHHNFLHDVHPLSFFIYKSKTNSSDKARDTHTIIVSFNSRSSGESTKSLCSGRPEITTVSHVPHVPF